MLSRLFDKARALDHGEAPVRLKFLRELTPDRAAQLQERLLELISREPQAEVRAAALPHITGLDALARLMAEQPPLSAELAGWIARERAPDAALCARFPALARARLLCTDSPAEQQSLLALFDDLETLVDLAIQARPALRDRILALPALCAEPAYTAIERLSRNRDKSVNRHARERLDAIRRCDEALTAVRERATTLAGAVATLRRQQLETPAARESRRRQLLALAGEYRGLMEREVRIIGESRALGASRDAAIDPGTFDGLDLEPPRSSPFAQLIEAVPPAVSWLEAGNPGGATSTISTLQEQWLEMKALAAPEPDESRRFAAIEEDYASVLAATQKLAALRWPELPALAETLPPPDAPGGTQPDGRPEARDFWRKVNEARRALDRHQRADDVLAWPPRFPVPAELDAARSARTELETRIRALDAEHDALVHQLEALFDEATRLVDGGQSKQAQAALQSLRRELGRLRPEPAQKLKARLDGLFHRLGELRDWQIFATSPKREALLASMQALIGTSTEPEVLATRIREIRHAWNQLGTPANRHEHALRAEFDAAAAKAFEPCRIHFAEQDRVRATHLEQRQALVAMLADYLGATDWQAADYQAAEAILQTARREWQAAYPLPRGDHKALVAQFESLQTRLHEAIHAHYKAASDHKRALITRLRELRTTAAVEDQVENVKRLQQEWKAIGPGLRHLEQPLWREFREVCDAVFADRSASFEAQKIARSALLTQAAEQNRQLALLLDAWTADSASPAVLRDARVAFEDLGDLGRDGRKLLDEHRDLQRRGEARLALFASNRRRARLDRIRQIDAALDAGETVDIDTGLQSYFAGRSPAGAQGHAAPEVAATDLVLLAEIIAETESPAGERRRRMELQVELMNSRTRKPDADSLLTRWCRLADKSVDDVRRARFFDAVASRLQR